MDKSKSLLKAISTSVFIFLSWGTLAVAENLPKSGNYYRSKDFLLAESPTVSQDRQKNQIRHQKPQRQIAQAVESEQPTELTEIESLGPNSNPLTFPTTPEEVEINLNEPITIEQAIGLALRNNRALEQARLTLERSEQELREARAELYPTLSTTLQLNNVDTERDLREENGQLIPDPDPQVSGFLDEEGIATNFTGQVDLDYEIYSGGATSADIKRAKSQLRISELDVERITEETRFEAIRDYYSLQDTIAQVENAEAAIEDATQTLRDAQLREQAGLGTRFDVLTAEVDLADAQQSLSTAIANRKIAQRTLAETVNVGQQVQLTPADEIEEAGIWSFSLEETIILAYRNRAELEQEIVSRELNEQQRKIALATIRPRISLFAQYSLGIDDIFEEFVESQERDTNRYSFGARLNWTLYDGGASKARADQEETDIALDESQFADQRNQIRLEVEQAYFSLEANQENIGTAEIAVERAEENLRLARLRFQAGVGTQNEVIDAQAQLSDARSNFLTAVINYNQSLNQLQRAVTNLPDGQLFDLP